MADGFQAEIAPGGHGIEKLAQNFAEAGRIAAGFFNNACEHHVGQQPGIFSEEAEDNPVEKMSDGGGVQTALSHGIGDFGKTLGGFLGDGNTGAAGPECFGIIEYSA